MVLNDIQNINSLSRVYYIIIILYDIINDAMMHIVFEKRNIKFVFVVFF